jgi:hypothetical protein
LRSWGARERAEWRENEDGEAADHRALWVEDCAMPLNLHERIRAGTPRAAAFG